MSTLTLEQLKAELRLAEEERSKTFSEWHESGRKCGQLWEQIRREEIKAEIKAEQAAGKEGK